MTAPRRPLLSRAAWQRIVPLALCLLLGALGRAAPAGGAWGFDPRWLEALAAAPAAVLLAAWWRDYGEFARQNRPHRGTAALAAGIGVALFALRPLLEAPWMVVGTPGTGFVPLDAQGRIDPALAALRWLGAALVAPLAAELFWRSFLMRWIERPQFETVHPQHVGVKAIVLSTFVFVLAQPAWLAAAIAGLAYALLYVRTGTLWAPVIAHATAQAALGAWVLWTRQWHLW